MQRLILTTLVGLLLQACATTPQSRIEKNPTAFSALSSEQQERVKAGRVGVGFDAAAVRLAIGDPDRVFERETSDGLTQVWVYYTVLASYGGIGYCAQGYPYYSYSPYCQPMPQLAQYEEHTRVVFKDGKVVSVERAK